MNEKDPDILEFSPNEITDLFLEEGICDQLNKPDENFSFLPNSQRPVWSSVTKINPKHKIQIYKIFRFK